MAMSGVAFANNAGQTLGHILFVGLREIALKLGKKKLKLLFMHF